MPNFHLIDHPQTTIQDLMTMIPGPDFPTADLFMEQRELNRLILTGKGVIQIRAEVDVESYGKSGDRERIVISELPYQVNKARLIEKIADLVNAKSITGISDIRDESSREGIRVCIDLKKGEIANVIINRLFINIHTK